MGHADKAHWLGGSEFAPEHTACNREDGKLQAKLSAKAVRVRATSIGIPQRKRLSVKYDWKAQRYRRIDE